MADADAARRENPEKEYEDEPELRLISRGWNALGPEKASEKDQDEWLSKFVNSPSALRLALNLFHNKGSPGHSVADCRLYGRNKVKMCKWNGWGYADTYVAMSNSTMICLKGSRYSLCGVDMAHWHDFVQTIPGIQFTFTSPAQSTLIVPPQRTYDAAFIEELQNLAPDVEIATSPAERLFHGHGHTCHEIFALRFSSLPRLPDVVLYPKQHKDVEVIVQCATRHNICLIPFGGGTSVTLGVTVPGAETRMVATVSLAFMQKILFLDRDALLLWVEAGAPGASLEERLRKWGVTLGHEPDSLEFSTVGGWVATRASGMKKNAYGNIEDMVVDCVVVTSKGTLNQRCAAPRVSSGPSLHQLALGSEGTLGIVTQVLLRVKLLPEKKEYGCLAFPTFKQGVFFLRQIALQRLQPASIRLMDKIQTQCGSLFRISPPGGPPLKEVLLEKLKKFYLKNIKGWKEEDLCACTLLFEGTENDVKKQRERIYDFAKKFGGLPAGSKNGERGYQMTFLIAYLRDFIMEHHWIFESFEASMSWPVVLICYHRVKKSILDDCKKLKIKYPPIVMVRLTQVYEGGAVLYFYFGFNWAGIEDPVMVYGQVEHNARQVLMDCGGCISHHHGVGKLRKEFMKRAVGESGVEMLRATKSALDPQNIFGSGNLI